MVCFSHVYPRTAPHLSPTLEAQTRYKKVIHDYPFCLRCHLFLQPSLLGSKSHVRVFHVSFTLRKQAYSNLPKILSPKYENFQIKNSDIFHTSTPHIGYSLEPPRRGGSNEYMQSMFLNRNKKNNVYPCKPQFYYIKVGFKGNKII